MGKLYCFRYEGSMCYEIVTLVIMEERGSKIFLDCFFNGKKFVVDITDKIDELCAFLEENDYSQYDGKNLWSGMHWFPDIDGEFVVQTDKVVCRCTGDNIKIGEILLLLGVISGAKK